MPLVQGAIDGVKMQAVSELREAGEGENRSHYGGDSIEDAALYAGRLASRGAEAFVRARMEELAVKRKEAAAPPLYDLPFDLTASQEPPVSPVSAASMDSILISRIIHKNRVNFSVEKSVAKSQNSQILQLS